MKKYLTIALAAATCTVLMTGCTPQQSGTDSGGATAQAHKGHDHGDHGHDHGDHGHDHGDHGHDHGDHDHDHGDHEGHDHGKASESFDLSQYETAVEGKTSLATLPGMEEKAPKITKKVTLKMVTDKGDLTLEVYPEIAPNAAKRFVELAELGFYNDTSLFRVVRTPQPFVVQFGINAEPGMSSWKDKLFKDDPSYYKLSPGTLAFAKGGIDTNSTQVFVNLGDNSRLASPAGGGFTTFGQVVSGMDVADKWPSVGDPSMGLSQQMLWTQGNNYIDSLPDAQKPSMIKELKVVKK